MTIHIASVPEAKLQRCIRCCFVIRDANRGDAPLWPGESTGGTVACEKAEDVEETRTNLLISLRELAQ